MLELHYMNESVNVVNQNEFIAAFFPLICRLCFHLSFGIRSKVFILAESTFSKMLFRPFRFEAANITIFNAILWLMDQFIRRNKFKCSTLCACRFIHFCCVHLFNEIKSTPKLLNTFRIGLERPIAKNPQQQQKPAFPLASFIFFDFGYDD